jgi:quinoprotein glucose dehydrogenase
MNTGERIWQVPVDSDPGYPTKGIKTGTGDLTKFGIAVTAGNLLLVPEPRLKKLMALDPDTGRTLWEGDLPEKAVGIPAVYSVNGREYIAMPAASGVANPKGTAKRVPPAEINNQFVVFALPEGTK